MTKSVLRLLAVVLAAAFAVVGPKSVGANPPIAGLVQVAPGWQHTCGLTQGGGVLCWGSNEYGQLGTGWEPGSEVAAAVQGLEANVVAIASGTFHSCAVLNTGEVRCWGRNDSWQTGIPGSPMENVRIPANVPGLTGVATISAGDGHTCALTRGGGVKCWGGNASGQLGNGGTAKGPADVVDVIGLASGVTEVRAGYWHTCARTAVGALLCWGSNTSGQLGAGSTSDAFLPVGVSGLGAGVTALAAGARHTCAVVTGTVKCWGSNGWGQLGTGSLSYSLVPVNVVGLASPVLELALGYFHSCARTIAGVMCWGMNSSGQLGNGTTLHRFTPAAVAGLPGGIWSVTSGAHHVCALGGGLALCWGGNDLGQLGRATSGQVRSPVDVKGLGNVAAIATGDDHSCALTSSGGIKCWGRNHYGQLGNGSADDSFAPVDVALGSAAIAVRAGGPSTCAVISAGGVKCWGWLAGRSPPVDVPGLATGVTDVAMSGSHACALTVAGAVKCWGSNGYGQLGNGATSDSAVPVDVVGLSANVTAIGVGTSHSCAILVDGGVRCWGDNHWGQLAVSSGNNALTPVIVDGLPEGAYAVDAGFSHTCVQTRLYTMKCWGSNGYAQFGLGHQLDVPGIHTVPLATGTLAVGVGAMHSCQIGGGGTVRCWGYNQFGQVGDGPGSATPYNVARSPFELPGISGATSLDSSGDHSCTVVAGVAKCWGANHYGQVGSGSGGYATQPQAVLAGYCGGFADVIAGNPFCTSVEWSRNRGVTNGCAPGLFCPMQGTTRVEMAAFLTRTGNMLTPTVQVAQAVHGAIDLAAGAILCIAEPALEADYPRRLHVDAILRVHADTDAGIAAEIVSVSPEGIGPFGLGAMSTRAIARAGSWNNVVARADIKLAPGTGPRISLWVSREGLPAAGSIVDSSCVLRVRAVASQP